MNIRRDFSTTTLYYDMDKRVVIDWASFPTANWQLNFQRSDKKNWGLMCVDEDDFVHVINRDSLMVTRIKRDRIEGFVSPEFVRGISFTRANNIGLTANTPTIEIMGHKVVVYRKLPQEQVDKYIESVEAMLCRSRILGVTEATKSLMLQLTQLSTELIATMPPDEYSYVDLYEALWKLLISVPYTVNVLETLEWNPAQDGVHLPVTNAIKNYIGDFQIGVSNNTRDTYALGYQCVDMQVLITSTANPTWVNDGVCVMPCPKELQAIQIQAKCLELILKEMTATRTFMIEGTYCKEIDLKEVHVDPQTKLILKNNSYLERILNIPEDLRYLKALGSPYFEYPEGLKDW